jgi:hypothetical protein
LTFSRSIVLTDEVRRQNAQAMLRNLPVDGSIEVVARTFQRQRSTLQNSYYWMRLTEIGDQAWIGGRRFLPETWHEHFKRDLLPDDESMPREILETLVKNAETYRKWDILPSGERVCVGSTTQLTRLGFAEYMTQIEAYATQELGVMFSAGAQWA